MIGRIYENRSGYGARWLVRFKDITRRFDDHRSAERFLTGLRFKTDEGTFDARDYSKERPLSFIALSEKWLARQATAGKRSIGHMRTHIHRAENFFGHTNVKEIGFGKLDDFVHSLPAELGDKTKANILATLHVCLQWICDYCEIQMPPKWPKVAYELGWRKTVDKETQQRLIQEVKRISASVDRKIGIAVEWLSRYYSIRPVELLHIREGDFDFELGGVNVVYNKERKPKFVPMLPEDLDLVRSFPRPIRDDLPFFRYQGHAYGRKRLYKWWKKACANLGVEGVDLYGGTRHSTVKALRHQRTPEEIRRGSMHSTNKAFERYFQVEMEDVRNIYADAGGAELQVTGPDTNLNNFFPPPERPQLAEIIHKGGRDAGI